MKRPIKSTDNRDMKKFDIKEWQTKNLNEGIGDDIEKSWKKGSKEMDTYINAFITGKMVDEPDFYKKNKKEVDNLKARWKSTKTLMDQCTRAVEALAMKAFKQEITMKGNKFNLSPREWRSKNKIEESQNLNEGNSYYDLKQQYYEISDNMGHGGLLTTLQDIKKKADTDAFVKIGGIDNEIKIFTQIEKLFSKSKLGKIL